MTIVAIEVLIIAALLLANGLLAMSEMAVVAARRTRLQQRADAGNAGAARALELQAEPTRFLSTVQIGITLVGIFAGAFGGATLARKLSEALVEGGMAEGWADAIGVAAVVAAITYCSLVIGELVPKRFALQHADGVASAIARPMSVLSKAARPLVALLSVSTDFVLRVLGAAEPDEPDVTEEEIRLLLQQGTESGLFLDAEQDLVSGVFRLGDRTAGELATPRTTMAWLDLDDEPAVFWQKAVDSRHFYFPVCRGSLDDVVGVLPVRDAWAKMLETGQVPAPEEVLVPPTFVPEATPALSLLDSFRASPASLLLVVDEFGGIEGLVTLTDVLEAIIGELPDSPDDPGSVFRREDGSWLLDGLVAVDEASARLEADLPEHESYHTIGGFVVHQLGRIPAVGDSFTLAGWRFEVVDMDGRRVDRVLASRL